MVGSSLGRYEIRGVLGEGGMGVVYRAWDTALDREVALKILPEQVASDPKEAERLREEARTVAALNHPNIITVFSVERDGDVEFITMERVEGRPLDELIPDAGLGFPDVLDYALPIVDAVASAHARGVTHRDLKPQNVMVAEGGAVKVLDFGLAVRGGDRGGAASGGTTLDPDEVEDLRERGVSEDTLHLAEGSPSGTLPYMAPELWRGAPADARSDVFATGVLLYELLTGERPFRGRTAYAVLAAILSGDPAPISRRGVPTGLDRMVRACLAQDPADRPTAIELRGYLESLEAKRIADPLLGRRRRRALLVAAPVALIALWLALPFLESRQVDEIVSAELLGDAPGSHLSPTLSPDGSSVAFVNLRQGETPQIWTTSVGGTAGPLTDHPAGATSPSWSPISDRLLFGSLDGAVWSIGSDGGAPTVVVENGSNPNWSFDGSSFVFERDGGIWLASSDGSDPRVLDNVPPSNFADLGRFPALSPDGRWVAFFQPALGPLGDYWIASTETDEVRRLSFDLTEGGAPAWTPDGEGLVVPSGRAGSLTLWRLPVRGGDPLALTTGSGEDSAPDIVPDASTMVYSNARTFYRIMSFDPETGDERVVLERRAEIPFPNWSPDGSRIVFFSREGATGLHVFTVAPDGSDVRQVTTGAGAVNALASWSPDGEHVYFYRALPDTGFYRVSASGGAAERVMELYLETHPGARERPGGGAFAVTRADRWRPIATEIRDAVDPQRVLATLAVPLRTPEWSAEGDSILGWDADNVITLCPADGTSCRRLLPGLEADWSEDGSEIFFLRPAQAPQTAQVWRMNRDGTGARPVGEIGPTRGYDVDFDVGPGNLIVWHQTAAGPSELWLAQVR